MAAGLFIDAAYVYREFIRHHGRVDYPKLRRALAGRLDDEFVASHYFNATDAAASEGVLALHDALRKWHFTVHEGWLQSRPLTWEDGSKVVHPQTGEPYLLKTQKRVDVSLAYHLVRSHDRDGWNRLALVTGDADFEEPIADLVREAGVDLHLVGVDGTISTRLQQYATQIHYLDHEPLRTSILFARR